jgi:hypothetical protein
VFVAGSAREFPQGWWRTSGEGKRREAPVEARGRVIRIGRARRHVLLVRVSVSAVGDGNGWGRVIIRLLVKSLWVEIYICTCTCG